MGKKASHVAFVLAAFMALHFAAPTFSYTIDPFCEACVSVEITCLCPANPSSHQSVLVSNFDVTVFVSAPMPVAKRMTAKTRSLVRLKIRMNC